MKHYTKYLLVLSTALVLAFSSCENRIETALIDIEIQLTQDGSTAAYEGKTVKLSSQTGSAAFEATTDESGRALFSVPVGVYSASSSFYTIDYTDRFNYNGLNSAVVAGSSGESKYNIELTMSKSSPIIVKELYYGGCPKDDGSGYYSTDQYVIIYNNGDVPLDVSKLCFAPVGAGEATATSAYMVDGVLTYENSFVPVNFGIWHFDNEVIMQPYSQLVIAMNGAIDHTQTYSQSVDLSNADYVFYDPTEGYTNTVYHPSPSNKIDPTHYMQAIKYSSGPTGNRWNLTTGSPAFLVFKCDDIETYARATENRDMTLGAILQTVKVPLDWVVDGIDTYTATSVDKCNKRIPASIDNGYVILTNQQGRTIYRNVDKEATEALPENEGKLVYNYSLGSSSIQDYSYGSTDPSGIDAEASMANGAHIVYLDSNNSANDFHERLRSSLRK